MPITPKQQAFAREYTIDHNGTQAAIRAGYSPKTANEQAARLLTKVSIKDAIRAIDDKIEKDYEITRKKQEQRLIDAYDMAKVKGQSSAMVSAAREMNEMSGFHREKALNPEKEAQQAARMTDAERRLAEITAQVLIDTEARAHIKLVRTGTDGVSGPGPTPDTGQCSEGIQ